MRGSSKRPFYFTRSSRSEGRRIRARVREVDNGKDFIQKRHMSRQHVPVAQAAIRPSQFSLPAAFERNTTPSLPLSAGCIFKTYHARDISRCRPLYSLSPNQAENHARTAYLRDTHQLINKLQRNVSSNFQYFQPGIEFKKIKSNYVNFS